MTKVIEVSSREDIERFVSANPKVIVDFAAESWCVPCQRLKPHYEKAAEQESETIWLHADIDIHPDLATEYGIQGVPTLLAYKDGDFKEPVPADVRTVVRLVDYSKNL